MSNFEQIYRQIVVELYNRLWVMGQPYCLDQVFIKLPCLFQEDSSSQIFQALSQSRHLLITGAPGSGKTTLLHWLAVIFAKGQQAEQLGVAFNGLPILVEIRSLVAFLQQPSLLGLEKEIVALVSKQVKVVPPEWLQEVLITQPVLLLLDGLDNVDDIALRDNLSEVIENFIHNRPNLMVVFTTRPSSLASLKLGQALVQFALSPFQATEAVAFLRAWYSKIYQTAPAEFIASLPNPVINLAGNPLLSILLTALYQERHSWPQRRVELYGKCCEMLLTKWAEAKEISASGAVGQLSSKAKLGLLERIAFQFQEKQQLALPEAMVIDWLGQGLKELKSKGQEFSKRPELEAQDFIVAIRHYSGLLQGRGDGSLEFSHRSLQEYLAARYIATQSELKCIDAVMTHLHEAWWREVHLLVIGYLGSDKRGAPQVARLMQYIWKVYKLPHPRLLPRVRGWEVGRRLPHWQWQRRVAWHLLREFVLVAQGFAECDTEGRTVEWTWRLTDFVNARVEEWSCEIRNYEKPLEWLLTVARQTLPKTTLGPAMEAFLAVLESPEAEVRGLAARSLGQLGLAKEEVIAALLHALQDESGGVRSEAAVSLGQLGVVKEEVLASLLMALQDAEERVRDSAERSLQRLGAEQQVVLAILLKIFGKAQVSWSERGEAAVNVCVPALSHEDWQVRSQAAVGLGQLKLAKEEVGLALLRALQDSHWPVRGAAAASLGELGMPQEEVVVGLLRALQDGEVKVRAVAAISLGRLGVAKEEVIAALLRALRSEEENMRGQAAASLGQLGEGKEEVVVGLLRALSDRAGWVRYQVAKSLGQVGGNKEEVVVALLGALEDEEARVRGQAAQSLQKLPVTESQRQSVLIRLNRGLHEPALRQLALTTLESWLRGQQLPGYFWMSLQAQAERKEKRERWMKIIGGGLIVLSLLFMVIILISGMNDRPVAQKLSILAPLVTIVVGTWQLSIWVDKYLVKKGKRRRVSRVKR